MDCSSIPHLKMGEGKNPGVKKITIFSSHFSVAIMRESHNNHCALDCSDSCLFFALSELYPIVCKFESPNYIKILYKQNFMMWVCY